MQTSDHSSRHAWVDASAGVAGDMLLGALLDAGASLDVVQSALEALVPGAIRLHVESVTRAGQRATKVHVEVLEVEPERRTWRSIRELLAGGGVADPVRERALAVFGALAAAEAQVHGTDEADVHFHEVGALDAIADVVGVCAALEDLRVTQLTTSVVALGSGRIRAAHGDLPVPVPAVLELARGRAVCGGGEGELTTPTGMALVVALSVGQDDLPRVEVGEVGVGAGSKDVPGRPNVTRVVLGRPWPGGAATGGRSVVWEAVEGQAVPVAGEDDEVVLETNVDDLDPRVWPSVLSALLEAGASDAWLSPILMKKGRPAHTLHVLAPSGRRETLRQTVFEQTSTIGVRETMVTRTRLDRTWLPVRTPYGQVSVKLAHLGGTIRTATPEFDDAAAVAQRSGRPVREVLAAAENAAHEAGLTSGARLPAGGTSR